MKPIRHILASREVSVVAQHSKNKKVEIYSFFPCDRADCQCQKIIVDFKKQIAQLNEGRRQELIEKQKLLVCPRDKKRLNRYAITCRNCGELLGYCWASDPSLKDWCDFHYVQWTDGNEWHGCLTPHVSPITQELCLECCCGEDTRDFRANMTLTAKNAFSIEERNKVGRSFNKSDSKFLVRKVKTDVLPFKKG